MPGCCIRLAHTALLPKHAAFHKSHVSMDTLHALYTYGRASRLIQVLHVFLQTEGEGAAVFFACQWDFVSLWIRSICVCLNEAERDWKKCILAARKPILSPTVLRFPSVLASRPMNHLLRPFSVLVYDCICVLTVFACAVQPWWNCVSSSPSS